MSMRRDPVTNSATFGSTLASVAACAIYCPFLISTCPQPSLPVSWAADRERRALSTSSSRPDPDGFDVEIFIELLDARLAPVAAHLVSTKRDCRVHRLIAVNPDGTGPDGLGKAMRLADVARPDPAAEPEWGGIGASCYLCNIREGNGSNDGAKDLLLGNAHGILHVRKHRGRDKVARRRRPFGQTLATHNGPGAFLLAKGQIARDTFELLLRDQRPNLCIRIKTIADFQSLCELRDLPNEIVIDAPLHKEARPSATNLARVAEDRHGRSWDGIIEIGIGKDDIGRLAAEFERHTFEIAR